MIHTCVTARKELARSVNSYSCRRISVFRIESDKRCSDVFRRISFGTIIKRQGSFVKQNVRAIFVPTDYVVRYLNLLRSIVSNYVKNIIIITVEIVNELTDKNRRIIKRSF